VEASGAGRLEEEEDGEEEELFPSLAGEEKAL